MRWLDPEAGAELAQGQVHGPHQLLGQLAGHLLGRGADPRRAQLQRTEQIGPERNQGALGHGHQTITLQHRGTTLAAPEGAVVVVARRPHHRQAQPQGLHGGLAAALPQASRHQDAPRLHGRNAIEATEVGEAQPFHSRAGRGRATAPGVRVGHGGIDQDGHMLRPQRGSSICQQQTVTTRYQLHKALCRKVPIDLRTVGSRGRRHQQHRHQRRWASLGATGGWLGIAAEDPTAGVAAGPSQRSSKGENTSRITVSS